MESKERDRDGEARPRRHLSSLVVRPSTSGSDVEEKTAVAAAACDGGGRGRGGGGGEEGERRLHAGESFHARSDRLHGGRRSHQGYGEWSSSVSSLHQRRADHDYDGDYDNGSPLHHGRGFERGRGPGRGRDFSPPYRSKQPHRRDFGKQEMEPAHFRGEGIPGNNHNISLREGDWLCSHPRCGNLNFARRSFCHNCKKGRFEQEAIRPIIRPRQGYPGPLPPFRPPPQMSGPPVERVSRREFHIYGASPPREWRRDGPSEYAAPLSPRRGERFSDLGFQMGRGHYHEEVFREMGRSDRLPPPEWVVPRSKGRGDFLSRRGKYSDRNKIGLSTSPPLQLPRHIKLVGDERERSRSPPRRGGYKGLYRGRPRGYPQAAERMNTNF